MTRNKRRKLNVPRVLDVFLILTAIVFFVSTTVAPNLGPPCTQETEVLVQTDPGFQKVKEFVYPCVCYLVHQDGLANLMCGDTLVEKFDSNHHVILTVRGNP